MSLDFGALASGALGFTMALAWTDAAKNVIKSVYPADPLNVGASARASIMYAAFVTIIIFLIIKFSSGVTKMVDSYKQSHDFKTAKSKVVNNVSK